MKMKAERIIRKKVRKRTWRKCTGNSRRLLPNTMPKLQSWKQRKKN